MILKQPEIIQILRKRAGMNQGQFGAKAFGTSTQKGRTKIKNIELGKQIPSRQDLEQMAGVLGLPVSALRERQDGGVPKFEAVPSPNPSLLRRFPALDVYLDLLNKAAALDDAELIDHIAAKICDLLGGRSSLSVAAPYQERL